MNRFLGQVRYAIVVVQQSDDGRKFNRGQLLNVGFIEAKRHAAAASTSLASVIFHDVDLLPSPELLPWYELHPRRGQPTHLAGPETWAKYAQSDQYAAVFFGGVTAFHPADFEACNGFPNHYWGWGLEDDQLRLRADESGVLLHGVRRPPRSCGGRYRDLDKCRVLDVLTDPSKRNSARHLWNDLFMERARQGNRPLQLDDDWEGSAGLLGLVARVLDRQLSQLSAKDVVQAAATAELIRVCVELA